MHAVAIRTTREMVNDYLVANGLEAGSVPLEVALLQHEGMQSGQPAVLLIATVDGKKTVIKTSLNMLITMTGGLRSAAEHDGWTQPP